MSEVTFTYSEHICVPSRQASGDVCQHTYLWNDRQCKKLICPESKTQKFCRIHYQRNEDTINELPFFSLDPYEISKQYDDNLLDYRPCTSAQLSADLMQRLESKEETKHDHYDIEATEEESTSTNWCTICRKYHPLSPEEYHDYIGYIWCPRHRGFHSRSQDGNIAQFDMFSTIISTYSGLHLSDLGFSNIHNNEDSTEIAEAQERAQQQKELDSVLQLQGQVREAKEGEVACSICYLNLGDTAFIPCGHKGYCMSCAKNLKVCAHCKITKTGELRIFDT